MANDNGGAGHLCPARNVRSQDPHLAGMFLHCQAGTVRGLALEGEGAGKRRASVLASLAGGLRNRDWCSSVPISQVAARCLMDESTVTRAYRSLHDSACCGGPTPVATHEIRSTRPQQSRRYLFPVRWSRAFTLCQSAPRRPPERRRPSRHRHRQRHRPRPLLIQPKESKPHVSWKERRKKWRPGNPPCRRRSGAISEIRCIERLPGMTFDAETTVSEDIRKAILAYLGALVASSAAKAAPTPTAPPAASNGPRKLTLFEPRPPEARLQKTASTSDVAELTRQVLWAVEQGALLKLPVSESPERRPQEDPRRGFGLALTVCRPTGPARLPPPETCGAA